MPRNTPTGERIARIWPALVCGLVLALAAPASAWSHKEHMLLTRIATLRLLADPATPPAMKQWLKAATPERFDMDQLKDFLLNTRVGPNPRGCDGLAYWSTVPDMVAMTDREDTKVAPFGVHERMLHFVDLELLSADPARRVYAHDLSNKPKLEDIPRDMADARWKSAGMLPFRVDDCYKRMVERIREGKLVDQAGQYPRDDHAARWAGYLAHYLADSCQPHHGTIDYQSRSYFKGFAGRLPGVHADMEFRLVDDENDDYMDLRKAFWDLFARQLDQVKDPIDDTDPFIATLKTVLSAYDALPLIGQAGLAAYKKPDGTLGAFDANAFFNFKGAVNGQEETVLEMKARQMALATRRIENVWRMAWTQATQPAPTTAPAQP